MDLDTKDIERMAHEIHTTELPAASFDDQMLFAWAKVKQISGVPDQKFTTRDGEMFMLGFAFDRAQVEKRQYIGPGYPSVSRSTVPATRNGDFLPAHSGIYFLWEGGKVVYVGRSTYLCDRVTLQAHHVLKPHHRISYIVMDRSELSWAEAFYIGVLRPVENFGKHATHRKRALLPAPKDLPSS